MMWLFEQKESQQKACFWATVTVGQEEGLGHKPTSKSYAAGLSSDNELSSLRGVRHF